MLPNGHWILVYTGCVFSVAVIGVLLQKKMQESRCGNNSSKQDNEIKSLTFTYTKRTFSRIWIVRLFLF